MGAAARRKQCALRILWIGAALHVTKRADGPRVEKADKPRAQTCIPGSFPSRGTHGRWVFLYPGHLALAGLAGALKDRP